MTTITGDAEEEVLSSEDSEEEVLDPAVEAVSAVEASEAVPVAVEVPAHVSKKNQSIKYANPELKFLLPLICMSH